jgi:PAS domain S-box-containing protein
MEDIKETREGPDSELAALRRRVAELEEIMAGHKQTMGGMQKSEEKLRLMFNSVTDGILVTDLNDVITETNNRVLEMHGFGSEDELLGKSALELVAPVDRERARLNVQETMGGSFTKGTEFALLRVDGSVFSAELSTGVLKDASGNPTGFITIGRDLTGRKVAEKALQESEQKYRCLFENLNDAAFLADAETGYILDTNKQGERLLGRVREEIIGMHQSKIHPPGKADEYCQRFAARAQRGRVGDYNGEVVRKDGSIISVSISAAHISIGGKSLILGLFRDITERKQAEKALFESEEKYRSLVKNVSLGVFRSTPGATGGFLEINPAMEEITGYSREELLQMGVCELYVNPGERKSFLEEITLAAKAVTRELDLRKKDGSRIVVSDTEVAVRDSSGRILYFDGVIEDITERKRMLEKLMITNRLACCGGLAPGVAGELDGPLTSIVHFAELLLEENVSDEAKENIAIIHHEARRANDVVRNLLTFIRKYTPLKELVDINGIIATALALRAYEQRINNIEVKTCFCPDLPQVMGDAFQLQQVFFNLFINAEYFMMRANGRGTLTITTQRDSGFVTAIFSDDGPGIPEENMRRLSIPFFTTKEMSEGGGLGLSICHGIVAGHGGKVYARSQPGKGASFFVELPVGAEAGQGLPDDKLWMQLK